MTKKEIDNLLYTVPANVDYTDMLEEVDLEDIPEETLDGVLSLLDNDEEILRYRAGKLLTFWGVKEGFDVLSEMFLEGKLEGYETHRLHNYDDTNRILLDAFISYWASQADLGNSQEAREEIFPVVKEIIQQAASRDYSLQYMSGLVKSDILTNKPVFTEYILYLKQFLSTIMDHPETNYWRIHDTLKLFLDIEPDYVTELLREKHKTLADFGLEEKDGNH